MRGYLVAHPCKAAIIETINRLGEASPGEIADASPYTLGTTSYHVRAMHDEGILRLKRTTPVRGAIKHTYVLNRAKLTKQLAALDQQLEEVQAARRAIQAALGRDA